MKNTVEINFIIQNEEIENWNLNVEELEYDDVDWDYANFVVRVNGKDIIQSDNIHSMMSDYCDGVIDALSSIGEVEVIRGIEVEK